MIISSTFFLVWHFLIRSPFSCEISQLYRITSQVRVTSQRITLQLWASTELKFTLKTLCSCIRGASFWHRNQTPCPPPPKKNINCKRGNFDSTKRDPWIKFNSGSSWTFDTVWHWKYRSFFFFRLYWWTCPFRRRLQVLADWRQDLTIST